MIKFFLIFGMIVSLVFSYANHTGWSVWDSISTGKWGPQGYQQSVHHK